MLWSQNIFFKKQKQKNVLLIISLDQFLKVTKCISQLIRQVWLQWCLLFMFLSSVHKLACVFLCDRVYYLLNSMFFTCVMLKCAIVGSSQYALCFQSYYMFSLSKLKGVFLI